MNSRTSETKDRHQNQAHPMITLHSKAKEWRLDTTDIEFAKRLDSEDPLRDFRKLFCIPRKATLPELDRCCVEDPEEECVYFSSGCGLMPHSTRHYVQQEFDKWADMGVQHFKTGERPWIKCDEFVTEQTAALIGAEENEVAVMNGLTVNLHLLLISFYQPTKARHKILVEDNAFSSDHFCVESQIKQRGYDPATSLLIVKPRPGRHLVMMEDILDVIGREGNSIAVVLLPGVHFQTGQVFDMPQITKAGQAKGCYVGFDLAHAIGNIEMQLHDWNIDFAVWCSYKYLCAGVGGIAGAYIHNRHSHSNFPKLEGWWGNRSETRFQLKNVMDTASGVAGYRITNPSAILVAALKASLDIFSQTSMIELRCKSKLLTAYLEYRLMEEYPYNDKTKSGKPYVEIITPRDPEERGAQLSAQFSIPITRVHEELSKRGVVVDERGLMRITPCPIYNSFEDIHRFIEILKEAVTVAQSSKANL